VRIKIIYYLRWILSGIIMYPIMSWLDLLGISLLANLLIGQSFGSIIFYNLDKKIFNKEI